MIVLGYIADWAYKPLRAGDIDRMTHVNIAFVYYKLIQFVVEPELANSYRK